MTIQFARQTSYALTIKETSLLRGLFFTVTLECEAPLNPQTGMTVDLPKVEASLATACAAKTRAQFSIVDELTQIWADLITHLPSSHQLKLLSLVEARGWGASYDGAKTIYSRAINVEIEGRVYRATAQSADINVWEKQLIMNRISDAESFMTRNSLTGLNLEECGTDRILQWHV